jgi:hypothetical protein
VEIFIPDSPEFFRMFFDHFYQFLNFISIKPTAVLKTNWFKPNFCNITLVFDMDLRRFQFVTGIKEKPIWANPKDGWRQNLSKYPRLFRIGKSPKLIYID